jgi:hypothetical protein
VNKLRRLLRRLLLPLFVATLVGAIGPVTALAATDPGLASAGNFAVLAGTTVTNTGPSWITGEVGVAPGTAIVGFPPGTSGPQHAGDSVATTAQTDLTAAYGAAVQPCTADYSGVNLGGLTLGPGVYCQTTAPTLTGTLTLNGSGIYIFLIGTTASPTTLVTAPSSRVILIGGAQPCQVFWRVTSSATIATSTTFIGTIMANIAISMQTGATLNGRALARTAAVTLDTNRIIQPSGCGYGVPTYVPPPTGNVLPATLGVPSELIGEIPWLLLIAVASGGAALTLGISSRRRRRRNA